MEKSIFEHPLEVSGPEMNAISFAFYKEFVRQLDPDELFEIPQFYVHRVCRIIRNFSRWLVISVKYISYSLIDLTCLFSTSQRRYN